MDKLLAGESTPGQLADTWMTRELIGDNDYAIILFVLNEICHSKPSAPEGAIRVMRWISMKKKELVR